VNYSVMFVGVALARCCTEAIRLAIEKVGVESVTGKDVRDMMVTLKDLNMEPIAPPITMTEDKPWALDRVRIWKCEGGKVVPVTDWLSPILSRIKPK